MCEKGAWKLPHNTWTQDDILEDTKYNSFFEKLVVMKKEGALSYSNLMCQILFASHGTLYPLGRVDLVMEWGIEGQEEVLGGNCG